MVFRVVVVELWCCDVKLWCNRVLVCGVVVLCGIVELLCCGVISGVLALWCES